MCLNILEIRNYYIHLLTVCPFSWLAAANKEYSTVSGPVFCFFSFLLFRPHWRYVEVPRLGVESELQLLAYTTATTAQDLSRIYDLHHSSRQRQILDPLTRPGMEPACSWILVGFVSVAPQWQLQDLFFM